MSRILPAAAFLRQATTILWRVPVLTAIMPMIGGGGGKSEFGIGGS